jgi:hypothetical protein
MLVLGIFAFLAAGSDPGPSSSSSGSATPSAPRGPSPKEAAISNTKLDFTWSKEGFGNVMEANFTINNKNDFAVKDVEIRCVSSAPSGTVIDSNTRVIYERFEAGKIKRITKFNMGFINSQAKSTSCSIRDLTIDK